MNREVICFDAVAPARERGLKSAGASEFSPWLRRSREGAWIEIVTAQSGEQAAPVAPARERGLKYQPQTPAPRTCPSLPRGSVD